MDNISNLPWRVLRNGDIIGAFSNDTDALAFFHAAADDLTEMLLAFSLVKL